MAIDAQGQSESRIGFSVSKELIAVAEEHLTPLLGELQKLDREAVPYEAEGAATRIREGLRARTAGEPVELSRAEAWATLRAIEHLRQFSLLVADLLRLRDALQADLGLAAVGFSYLLCEGGRNSEEQRFVSYSGPYSAGDRLVASDGRAWRIRQVQVEPAGQPECLVVEPWPAA